MGDGKFIGMRCAAGNDALELVSTWKPMRWAGPDR
jgi:hypothetical protein